MHIKRNWNNNVFVNLFSRAVNIIILNNESMRFSLPEFHSRDKKYRSNIMALTPSRNTPDFHRLVFSGSAPICAINKDKKLQASQKKTQIRARSQRHSSAGARDQLDVEGRNAAPSGDAANDNTMRAHENTDQAA